MGIIWLFLDEFVENISNKAAKTKDDVNDYKENIENIKDGRCTYC